MDIPKFVDEFVLLEEDKCFDHAFESDNMGLFLDLLRHRIANGDMSVVDTYKICSFGFDPSIDEDLRCIQLARERTAVKHELEIIVFTWDMDVEACKAEIEELAKSYKGENLEKRLTEIMNGHI